jgi:hypothetical protein
LIFAFGGLNLSLDRIVVAVKRKGLHFGFLFGRGPGAEGKLGIVVGDAGGFEGGDGDVAAPSGFAGGSAQEDLAGHWL